MDQPFGVIRFYDSKDKWTHNRNNREVSPAKIPVIWENNVRLPQFQLFTETDFDPITVFKVVNYSDTTDEVDLIADVADITKISASAYNQSFNAWVYYSSGDLSETLVDGLYYIEISDGSTTYYSNVFKLET